MSSEQNTPPETSCCAKKPLGDLEPKQFSSAIYFLFIALTAAVWWFVYESLVPFADWAAFDLIGLVKGTKFGDAVEFFIYDTLKIFMLLVAIIYGIAWIRVSLSVEKVRDYLAGKNKLVGYSLAAVFGAITPFCSCSSVPLFLGFTTARIPIGITMSFLFSSPLADPVSFGLFWGIFGWPFAVIYLVVGMLAGIVAGVAMDALKVERWLQPFLLDAKGNYTPVAAEQGVVEKLTVASRHSFALAETKDIFNRVWIWVIAGVGLGAALHGYMPEEWITNSLGKGQWWSVPLAVAAGIPLYTNTTGLLPVMESLLLKGLPVGTTLALCMSTIAVSLPELMMLKQVMRWQLLAFFVGLALVIFTAIGWIFNAISFAIL